MHNAQKLQKLTTPLTFRSGVDLYMRNVVRPVSLAANSARLEVYADKMHSVFLDWENDNNTGECTCENEGICDHLVAAWLFVDRYSRAPDKKLSESKSLIEQQNIAPWEKALQAVKFYENKQSELKQSWVSGFIFKQNDSGYSLEPVWIYVKKDLTLGQKKPYDRKNDQSYIEKSEFTLVMQYLQKMQSSSRVYTIEPQHFPGYMFALLANIPLVLENGGDSTKMFSEREFVAAEVQFHFIEKNDFFRISPHLNIASKNRELRHPVVLSNNPIHLLHENQIFRIENIFNYASFRQMVFANQYLRIPKTDMTKFWNKYYQNSPFKNDFIFPDYLFKETRHILTGKKIFLTEENRSVYLQLVFSYGDIEITSDDDRRQYIHPKTGQFIHISRDDQEEKHAISELLETNLTLTRRKSEFTPKSSISSIEWVYKYLPRLREKGFAIYGENKLVENRVNRSTAAISISYKIIDNWIEATPVVNADNMQVDPALFFKAIRDGRQYVPLDNGEQIRIAEKTTSDFRILIDQFDRRSASFRLSKIQLPILLQLKDYFQSNEQLRLQTEPLLTPWQKQLQTQPHWQNNFRGELREYQKEGIEWLRYLYENEYGGCLADDMGLGKTIQVLFFLNHLYHQQNVAPTLIVMPASLIFNWKNEIEKFTPNLKVIIYSGIQRHHLIRQFAEYNIVLTTYGVLRNDREHLADEKFEVVVLDESQYIKNPLSKAFRAATSLNAKLRITLSGTPIENSTIDIWSQMAYLNPGFLGKLNWFRRHFSIPIEKNGDRDKAELLNRLMSNFVLRRKKENVEKDLPDKTEQIIYCKMTPEQESFYHSVREDYLNRIQRKKSNVKLNHIRIIEYLTRLRQICNHPRLVNESYEKESGKLNVLQDLITDIVSENRKVLVFSQFVKMLSLIKGMLDDKGLGYYYLDGSTKNREQLVTQFQETDNNLIFLISIKAGGTGLNLTAAEYVILVDPWWNPAVENQANDRAHRIGQTRNVHTYKLLAHQTVEEKIVMLQEAKKVISDQLIEKSAGGLAQMEYDQLLELFRNE
jgi:non-specific serine/threonine protein kinase